MYYKILLFSLLTFFLVSCNKKVQSDFVLNQYEYAAGEMLDISNPKPRKKQFWQIVNESGLIIDTSSQQNPQFVLDLMLEDGIYTINLYDNEKEYKKELSRSKEFLVKTLRGELWLYSFGGTKYKLYVDGQFIDEASGQSEYDLPVGVRYVEIHKLNEIIQETVVITEGSTETISF